MTIWIRKFKCAYKGRVIGKRKGHSPFVEGVTLYESIRFIDVVYNCYIRSACWSTPLILSVGNHFLTMVQSFLQGAYATVAY